MGRIPRVVIPGVPHHVTQRGSRRMAVFFSDRDYRHYLLTLRKLARKYQLDTWAYCLMPNHVHLIVVPASVKGLARPIAETHRRHAIRVNRREGWTGHLWQERFSSFPMEEAHLFAAVRYVLLNPVRAGLVSRPIEWRHSSARAHLRGEPDLLVDTRPMAQRIQNWSSYLEDGLSEEDLTQIRRHTSTGRPLGSKVFVRSLELLVGRRLRPRKRGPAPRED